MPVCTTIYAPIHMTLGDLRMCQICCWGGKMCSIEKSAAVVRQC